jgi:ClpP class serine protease
MTFKDRLLWKEGDITMEESNVPLTEEQKEKARKTMDEVIREFKRKMRETR